MKYSKLTAFAAALALLGGQPVSQTVISMPAAAVSDAESIAGSVTLKIGESVVPQQTSGSETPSWTSDDPKIASVSAAGEITGVSEGTTYINAIFSSGIQKFKVTVIKKSDSDEDKETVTDLGTVQLDNSRAVVSAKLNNAPDGTPVWSSSDTKVASVDQEGTITAVGSGECTVTAVIGKNKYVLKVVSTFRPEDAVTEKQKFTLGKIELSDDKPSVTADLGLGEGVEITWSSSDDKIATVDKNGRITAHSAGSCKITAETENAVYIADLESSYTGSPDVTEKVIGSVKLTQDVPDKKLNLTITDFTGVKWSSTDEKVAVPDGSGRIIAVGSGSCQIRFIKDSVTYIVNVESEFRPASELKETDCSGTIIGLGNKMELSGGSSEVLEWESLNEDVAVVSDKGVVTSKSEGIAVIKAHYADYSSAIAVQVRIVPLPGDADCDAKVKMNDAVLIMQSMSNPDRYTLEGQAEKNADCYGKNDGITPNDALAVQKYLLNIYKSLPVEE